MAKKQKNSIVDPVLRVALFIIGVAGVGTMAYLTQLHFAPTASFCDLSEAVSCNAVNASVYSEILSIPVSILGLLYFAIVALYAIFRSTAKQWSELFLLTLFVLIPSLYLTLVEATILHTWCVLCEGSKVLMVLVAGVTYAGVRADMKNPLRLAVPIVLAGVVAAFLTFLFQQGNVTRADYTPLVHHMNEQGWTYYKSYVCQNCARQGQILGSAYEQLNSVECHPNGPGGQPQLCLEKGIDKTPTWVLESDDREIKRLEGRQSIEALIEASDFTGNPIQE